jgi:hypothetical protein
MENVFDALCTSLHAPAVKTAFLEGEGIELMCLMLKEKKLSRTRAIKTLDHALQGQSGIALCEKFVELLGLKTLFSAFMGKVSRFDPYSPSSRSRLPRTDSTELEQKDLQGLFLHCHHTRRHGASPLPPLLAPHLPLLRLAVPPPPPR